MVETFQHASTGITNLAQQKCQNLLYLNNNKNPSWQSLSIRVPMGDACRVDTLPLFRYVDSAADVKTHSPPQVTPRLGLGKGKAPVMHTPERGIGGRAIRRQETRRPVQQRPQISAQSCRPLLESAQISVDKINQQRPQMIRGPMTCKKCGEKGHRQASYKCPLNGTKKRHVLFFQSKLKISTHAKK